MISPDDLLAEAQCLVTDDASEARFRSSISRAYYACFHLVITHPRGREVMKSIDSENHSRRVADKAWQDRHHALTRALVKSGARELVFVASDLAKLLLRRNRADYDIDAHVTRSAAEFALKLADDVFRDLSG